MKRITTLVGFRFWACGKTGSETKLDDGWRAIWLSSWWPPEATKYTKAG